MTINNTDNTIWNKLIWACNDRENEEIVITKSNKVDGAFQVMNDTVMLGLLYDRTLVNSMSELFWENANGNRYILRVNSETIGFDYDGDDELVPVSDISEIDFDFVTNVWEDLIDRIEPELDQELIESWENPFNR